MTENSKIPPAKKTIEDPPEYGAAAGESNSWSGRGKPPEQPSGGTEAAPSEAAPSEAPHVASGGIGGESETAPSSSESGDQAKATGYDRVEATYQQNGQSEVNDRGRVPVDDVTKKKAPKGSLSGGAAGRMGTGNIGGDFLGGPQDVAEVPNEKESGPTGSGKYAAEGEGARNPQTGERIARNPRTGS